MRTCKGPLLPGILAILVISQGPSHAAEELFEEFNFAIELPAGEAWQRSELPPPKQPVLLQLGVQAVEAGTAVRVQVLEVPEGTSLEMEDYREGLKKGMLKSLSGLRIDSEQLTEFAGVPALRLLFRGEREGEPCALRIVLFLTEKRQYGISVLTVGEEQDSSPEIEKAFSSFRFLETPRIPEVQDLPFRVGYAIGYYVVPAVLLIGLFSLLRRRRGKNA